ncbi:putative inactive receptor-like protein kinase At1g64210 [Phoenix dactylifera]|uniref:Inactive receptor-like protein kinase At1g64210 n=1 Tax=Phoenix dactylifera TaxID=42345 RepID=A0A8B9A0L3_PHODC|nr:putative inactive receptor-like protein kinase At1g64210 [Phoenix dactylifera]
MSISGAVHRKADAVAWESPTENSINPCHERQMKFPYSMAISWQQRSCGLTLLWPVCILALTLGTGAYRSSTSSESKSLIQFIQAADPENILDLNWNGHIPDHCSGMWMGIKCDVLSLHVTEIRLENMNISGRIDADSLCKLPSLQFLSLAINHITGDIPESMSNCLGLTYLNLSSNMLNGKVPASMESLKNLRSFDISNNNLTGYIPHFKQEIELVYHNTMISGMSVNETDPAIKASDDKIRDNVNQPKAPTLAWSITILTLVLLITFFSLFIFFTDKKNPKVAEVKESKKCVHESSARNYTTGTEDDIEKGGKVQDLVFFGERQEKFTMDDLLTSAADLQGRNIYSSLYKIRLKNSSIFVVKRLKNLHVSGDDFKQKVMRIGNLKHPNLLPLVACHSSDHDKLLIYRYQNSGSLSSLFSSKTL